jgi:hypothetical protein
LHFTVNRWSNGHFHTPNRLYDVLFICCHPDPPATQQIALALRIVSGLTVKEIASAFLVGESAMEQRITRAKRRVAAANTGVDAGCCRAGRTTLGRGRHDLPAVQRGLRGEWG